ncbi:ester cyclase [Paraburkholderia acidicola]|uniref:Ester cyclase n=1 Tax=Paraburkholderia acidicola TaxID=1912599 RepID=A0ABV1LQC0_9BURK
MDRRTLISGSLAGAAIAAMTPLHAQSAQSAQNVATRFASTLSAHDIDAFAALFSGQYVNHQLSAAATPPAGVSNKTATVNFFRARLTGLPDLNVTIETTVIDGDKCAASFVYEGTHEGIFFGVAPTGKKLRFTSCDIFRVADGLIVEHWGMGDIAGVLAQLKG